MESDARTHSTPRHWPTFPGLPSVKARIICGFGLLVIIVIGVAAGSAWQVQTHRSNLADLESHSTIASLLQEAQAEAATAALLLQRHVISGEEYLVAEVETHAWAAVDSLNEAVAQGAPPGVDEIAVGGVNLAEGAVQITALRQSGDIEGAAAATEQIVPVFREFRYALEDFATQELDQVSSLRSSADRNGTIALWLLIVSGGAGAVVGLAASGLIARSIFRPLSRLEATAKAVSEGDLSARVTVRRPRELAHLGEVLNDMMEAIEAHTEKLRLANEELQERNRQLMDARAQAATDPLTGLGNHRTFHKRIRDEVASTQENGASVGLILLDIDGFKGINDSLGHLAGDDILRKLALALRGIVNEGDAYRYGGDEFAVVLPGASHNKTAEVAEQLRLAVEGMTVGDDDKLTVSLGVGSLPEMAASAEELVYRADMAMYWAKSTGKNRVGDWDGLLSRRTEETGSEYLSGRRTQSDDVVAALLSALAAKDPVTRAHSDRCTWYVARLAKQLGLSEQDTSAAALAALLHDVGKLAIPDYVLCKPGPLDENEWVQIRQHPTIALHMLSHIEEISDAIPIVLHHHEHFDGSGYPDSLAGHDIPIASRVMHVIDAFDAMTTDRPYRKAMPVEAAVEELRRNSGSQFDPDVVEAFLKMLSDDGLCPLLSAAVPEGRPVELP